MSHRHHVIMLVCDNYTHSFIYDNCIARIYFTIIMIIEIPGTRSETKLSITRTCRYTNIHFVETHLSANNCVRCPFIILHFFIRRYFIYKYTILLCYLMISITSRSMLLKMCILKFSLEIIKNSQAHIYRLINRQNYSTSKLKFFFNAKISFNCQKS